MQSIGNFFHCGNWTFYPLPTIAPLNTRIKEVGQECLKFLDDAYKSCKINPMVTTFAVFSTLNLIGYAARFFAVQLINPVGPLFPNLVLSISSVLILIEHLRCRRHNLALCEDLEVLCQNIESSTQDVNNIDEKMIGSYIEELNKIDKEWIFPVYFSPYGLAREAYVKRGITIKLEVFQKTLQSLNPGDANYMSILQDSQSSVAQEVARLRHVMTRIKDYHSNYSAKVY